LLCGIKARLRAAISTVKLIFNIVHPSFPTLLSQILDAKFLSLISLPRATGIVLASTEELFSPGTGQIFIAALTQATFTPGSPGTWSAPSQLQTLSDFASPALSFGPPGLAVATGSHIAIVTGEFGGSGFGAIQLPSTSGSGTPSISDWVECNILNDPKGNPGAWGLILIP
jgi:hypothetical protein